METTAKVVFAIIALAFIFAASEAETSQCPTANSNCRAVNRILNLDDSHNITTKVQSIVRKLQQAMTDVCDPCELNNLPILVKCKIYRKLIAVVRFLHSDDTSCGFNWYLCWNRESPHLDYCLDVINECTSLATCDVDPFFGSDTGSGDNRDVVCNIVSRFVRALLHFTDICISGGNLPVACFKKSVANAVHFAFADLVIPVCQD